MVYAYLQRSWQCSHNLTDTQQEALEMAVSEPERMTQILQNLFDLAQASNSMMPLQSESLILNDVVADIAQMTEKFDRRVIHLEGLGLSIVKSLVENMGGKVGIKSEPGYGSTFILKLPTLGVKI